MRPQKIKPGMVFDRITVISQPYSKSNGKRTYSWVTVKCECGKQWDVKCAYLLNGHTKSCGCLRTENLRNQGKVL